MEAHQGTVRCGHCQTTFNAAQHLYAEEPSPQLNLPIELEVVEPSRIGAVAEPLNAVPEENDHTQSAPPAGRENPGKTEIAAIESAEIAPVGFIRPKQILPGWSWHIGALIMLALLLAQASYFFRVELAARLPGLKPVLVAGCMLLKCTIPLPQKADQMSIESSELEADPQHINFIMLNAILRNRAPYALAFPNLELTLTDVFDEVLARRIFVPAEYIQAGENEMQGLASSRETNIKLHLDTTDLKPTGYRLFLYYP